MVRAKLVLKMLMIVVIQTIVSFQLLLTLITHLAILKVFANTLMMKDSAVEPSLG